MRSPLVSISRTATAEIVYMNRAAEHQVRTSNAIRVANNHLSPIDHKARPALDRAIDEAAGDEADLQTGGFPSLSPRETMPV